MSNRPEQRPGVARLERPPIGSFVGDGAPGDSGRPPVVVPVVKTDGSSGRRAYDFVVFIFTFCDNSVLLPVSACPEQHS